ncbi:MAG: hypothetical protein IH903_02290 [Proteobacteria bacterium]|nr:hypothetical protein [Pseudomonadota bacterium]
MGDTGLYQIGQPVHQVEGGVRLDEGAVGDVIEDAGAETGHRLRPRRFDDIADRLAQGPVSPPQGLIAGAPMRGVLGNRQIRFPAGNHDASQRRNEASLIFHSRRMTAAMLLPSPPNATAFSISFPGAGAPVLIGLCRPLSRLRGL